MDDEFVKELEELTKGLEKEFLNEIQSENKIKPTVEKKDSTIPLQIESNDSLKNNPFDFFKNLDDNDDLMAGIEKLLNMKDLNLNQTEKFDDSDPQTKEMIKLLSNKFVFIDTIFLF
jgi:hypothetical protein